jgi:hypothetical protein
MVIFYSLGMRPIARAAPKETPLGRETPAGPEIFHPGNDGSGASRRRWNEGLGAVKPL